MDLRQPSPRQDKQAPSVQNTDAENTGKVQNNDGHQSANGDGYPSFGQRLKSSASLLSRAAFSTGPQDANAAFAAQLQATEKAPINSSSGAEASSSAAAAEAAEAVGQTGTSSSSATRQIGIGDSFRSRLPANEQTTFPEADARPALLESESSAPNGALQNFRAYHHNRPRQPIPTFEHVWSKTITRSGPESGTYHNDRDDPTSPLNQVYRAVASKYRLAHAMGPLLPLEIPGGLSEAMRQEQSARLGPVHVQGAYEEQIQAFNTLSERHEVDPAQVNYPPAEWLDLAVPNYLDYLPTSHSYHAMRHVLSFVRAKWNEAGPGKFQADWYGPESEATVSGWQHVQHKYARQLVKRQLEWNAHTDNLLHGHESVQRSVGLAARITSCLPAQDGAEVVALLNEPGSLTTGDVLEEAINDVPEQTVRDLFGPTSKPQDPSVPPIENAMRSSLPPATQHQAVHVDNPMNLKPEGYDDDDEGFLASWRDVLERYTDDVWDPESQPWVKEAREELKKVEDSSKASSAMSQVDEDRRKSSIRRLRQLAQQLKIPTG